MAGPSFQILLAIGAPFIAVPTSLGTATGAASTSTNALTTVATVPAGGVIFVTSVFVKSITTSITSITDSNGNTYQAAVTAGWNATNFDNQELWYAVCAAQMNSGSTITVNISNPSTSNPWPMCAAFTTGLTATPLDKTNSTKYEGGSGTLASGVTATLTQAKELIIGATGFYTATTFTEDATFTQINDLDAGAPNHLRSHLAYKIVNATTAVNYQPSSTATIFGASIIATFKGA